MRKRILAGLLCLCLVAGMLPSTVLAEEGNRTGTESSETDGVPEDNEPDGTPGDSEESGADCARLEGCADDVHAEGCPLYVNPEEEQSSGDAGASGAPVPAPGPMVGAHLPGSEEGGNEGGGSQPQEDETEEIAETLGIQNGKVRTEEELRKVIEAAAGAKDAPVEIIVSADIVLTAPIAFSNKFILLRGETPGITISAGEACPENTSLFQVGDAADTGTLEEPSGGLSLQQLTIDMKEKGRAIFAVKSEINFLEGCTVQNGLVTGTGDGGAIYLSDQARANLYSGAALVNNECRRGGAICIWPDGIFHMYGGTLGNNTARGYGGAVWNTGGTVYMEGGTVSGNSGGDYGAIGSQANSSCIIDSKNPDDPVRIIGNTSNAWRAGVFGNAGSTLLIKGALFQDNKYLGNPQAGAIMWGGSSNGAGSCRVEDCTFIGNSNPACRFNASAIWGGNRTDETQTVQIPKDEPLQLSKAIPEDTALCIFYVNNGYLSEGKLVVEGSGDYRLTEDDLARIVFDSDSAGNWSLVLDKDSNSLKTIKGVTVTFHSNTDAAESATQTVPSGQPGFLKANPFTWENHVFDGWNTAADGSGDFYKNCAEVTFSEDTELYARWRPLDEVLEFVPKAISMEYGSEKKLPAVSPVTEIRDLVSSDPSVVSVKDDTLKAEKVGKAVLTGTAVTENGGETEVEIEAEVLPMLLTYGEVRGAEDGWDAANNRPSLVYFVPEGGTGEALSAHIRFYPARENTSGGSGGSYAPDPAKAPVELKQGTDLKFSYMQNGSRVETDALPSLATTDREGNPKPIEVLVNLENENYRFVTAGTSWKPENQIKLSVTVMAKETGEDNDGDNNGGRHHGGGSGSGGGSSSKPAEVKGAKTGDETSALPFVLLPAALGGVALCAYALHRRKKTQN